MLVKGATGAKYKYISFLRNNTELIFYFENKYSCLGLRFGDLVDIQKTSAGTNLVIICQL